MSNLMRDLMIRAEVLDLLRCSKWKLDQLVAARKLPEPIRYPQANGKPGRVCYWPKGAVLALVDELAREQMSKLLVEGDNGHPHLLDARLNDPFGRCGPRNASAEDTQHA